MTPRRSVLLGTLIFAVALASLYGAAWILIHAVTRGALP